MPTTIVTAGGRSRLVHPAEVPLFGTIEVDIPWSSDQGGGKIKRGADRHYPPLKPYEAVEAIIKSPLWRPDRAQGCHLWLWVTNLCVAARHHLVVLDALGFREVSFRTWVKERVRPGLGKYMRGETEHAILATCGPARVPPPMKDPPSTALIAPVGRHSEKPPANVADVERISPGPRAELFARQPREGWYSWGNDPALAAAVAASEPAPAGRVVIDTGASDRRAVEALGLKDGAPELTHLPACELGMGDGEEVWTCHPDCRATRPGVDVVAGRDVPWPSGAELDAPIEYPEAGDDG